ncbi:MAG TPA: DUF4139 domain-containing protein [Candidatus Acidoferrales bacterium]|jgi:hypothetical protein|nr:DUF4139 domain-containing protein [Candidatus Acidoferrales bacterium]
MKRTIFFLVIVAGVAFSVFAQPALTIYNQNFAVVRDTLPLDLKSGVTQVAYSQATAHVEPDSVILRDPSGQHPLQILEQSYRNDPVSQDLLLSLFEGKTIEFQNGGKIIKGKIIRSGYVPHYSAMNDFGEEYQQQQMEMASQGGQPIIEVDGQMQFGLPGQPLFPDLGDDTILKPTLNWLIQSDNPGQFDAEVGYLTGGFTWEADYNLVSPEKGDDVDLIGWVTINNQSGKTFDDAKIKLMAGDVNRVQSPAAMMQLADSVMSKSEAAPAVTEKAFDEYHLYTLERPTTLRDREMKQIEFVHAEGIQSKTIYVYDGAELSPYYGYNIGTPAYGTQSNKKVRVIREFTNSESNHLGMPLPKGKLRFYRRDADGQLEFIGEDQIDHTPKDETIRVTTGNAFDLVGERKQTNFRVDNNSRWAEESFEIKLRNHKKEAVSIRVVEHLYRWNNWEITAHTEDFTKTDSHTIEFDVPVNPDQEKTLDYTVHYTW